MREIMEILVLLVWGYILGYVIAYIVALIIIFHFIDGLTKNRSWAGWITCIAAIYPLASYIVKDKIEKEERVKLQQEWMQEAHRRRNNLLQACKTESKMTVYQKIPEKSDIFFERDSVDNGIPGQSVPHPEAAEMKFELRKLIEKCKNTEGKSSESCYEQFEWSITWHSYFKDTIQRYANTDFVYEVPIIEDDSKTYHFTPYRFIVEDISSITDRQNGIRRGKMLLKNIKNNQIVSEYIGFEVVPYGTTTGASHSAVNCFSDDKEWNEHIQNGDSNRALSSGDDGAVFEHFFNHAVDKSKKVAKPKLKK